MNNEQKACIEQNPIGIARSYHYERFSDGGRREAELTVTSAIGEPVTIEGNCQTIDELEIAVARLIATARKEVSHGKAVQPTRELAHA